MSESVSWRAADPETFRATILTAAERLVVQPLAVEKDYWVCEVLRSIVSAHPDEVVFKGGTSLEKLRIIRRFSEDLDLLVIGRYPSKNATKNALKTILNTAATATGGKPTEETSGGSAGTFHRRGYLGPPLDHANSPGAIADPAAVLVELGQAGGPNPHSAYTVTSLLARELDGAGFDTFAWADLAPFDVQILHPGRTLLEKLLRVNNFAHQPELTPASHGWPRIGRQFYDIHALLLNQDVRALLADKQQVTRILQSAREVSEAFRQPDLPVPAGGFARSPVFDPTAPIAARLRAEHDGAMRDLYYGTEAPPSYEEIIERVHADAEMLAP